MGVPSPTAEPTSRVRTRNGGRALLLATVVPWAARVHRSRRAVEEGARRRTAEENGKKPRTAGFKKEGKASGLVTGMAEPEADKFGNVLGPFPFMTAQNTKIGKSTDAAPPKITGMNYGIEFAGEMKWYELGLKGLVYIKDVLGVPSVTYMVFGLGGAVTKELEKVAETPSAYPAGITKDKVKIIEVIRA